VNVLFLSHRLPYAPNRGDRIRAFHLLREMSRWSDVDLISLVHDREEAAQVDALRSMTRSVTLARVPKLRNTVSAIAHMAGSTPATHMMLFSPDARAAIDAAASRKPDVVFSYCTGVAPLALTPALSGRPLVLDMVDVDSEKWAALATKTAWPRSWVYRREARLLRAFERHMTRRARATLVVNAKEQATLFTIAPGASIHTVENGVDTSSFRPQGPPAAGAVVVFCGVMNYPPNVDGAVWLSREVWPLVRRAHPAARLDLVGSNPAQAVSALSDPARGIRVTGAVPDVRPYLWNASVACAPLHTARGVQNKVLEAVAAGLPTVVTSAVHEGLPPDVLGACHAADTPAAFAAAIAEFLALEPARRRERAISADLSALGWERRLAGLKTILLGAG
jgi:sugar transferase (PEP-CTERM/EpsH1 system associated)